MIVHPVIYNLEQLRDKLNTLQFEINQQLDFLDRGKPEGADISDTQQLIKNLRGEAAQILTIFENTIQQVLVNRPKLIKDWANRHINFYREILTELEAETPPNNTQIFLAQEMINQWGKVIEGKQMFVLDPLYLITHYRQRQKDYFGLEEYDGE